MYNNFIGTLEAPDESEIRSSYERKIHQYIESHGDYDHVRYGLPNGTVKYEKEKDGIKVLLDHYFKHGYSSWPAKSLSSSFRKHVAKFRACLDLWEQFSTTKIFSKDELYVRCLREGPSFTEFIKKTRATCLRGKTSETSTDVEEDEFFEEYDGYNCIMSERYLIHWDDTDSIDDVKYAFVPRRRGRVDDFRKKLDVFWEDFRLGECNFTAEFDMFGSLKNTKMYDPVTKKTHLMREFWSTDINITDPYFAKRAVVPTQPGSTRDTGVGSPSTILKVKLLNQLARVISEKIPFSANAPGPVANSRLKRVLKRNAFLHLDFKKFGLTFPRELANEILRKIGRETCIDVTHLLIEDFFVEINGETYRTERGSMLGWLDSLNSIAVSVILYSLIKEEGLLFDFITFNDDVEISKRAAPSSLPETLELLRLGIIAELDSYDILISMNKTYGSRASVFLERYAYYTEEYGLDMYKEQLTVEAYAKSLVTEFPWQAKMFFSAAEQWTKSDYARDRCIDTCPIEFRTDEIHMSLWSGGWYLRWDKGLDLSMVDCDQLGLRLGIELSKFDPPRYATKREKPSSHRKISERVNNNCYQSYSSGMGRTIFDFTTQARELNEELEVLYLKSHAICDIYPGQHKEFAEAIRGLVSRHILGFLDPGG